MSQYTSLSWEGSVLMPDKYRPGQTLYWINPTPPKFYVFKETTPETKITGQILWSGKITLPAPKFHSMITNWTDEAAVVEAEPNFPANSDGMW